MRNNFDDNTICFGSKLQIQKYKAFITEGLPDNKNRSDSFFDKIKRIPILGSDAFIKTVTEKYLDKNTKLAQPSEKSFFSAPEIATIMQIVAYHYHIEINELKIIDRWKNKNKPRAIAVYLSCLLSNKNLQDIADEFTNISYHGVSKTFYSIKQELVDNIKLVNELNALTDSIIHGLSVVET